MEAFWLGIAYVSGLAAKAVRLPTLVGFLIAGLVLSAFGATASDLIITIGDYGVIFLLFTVGLHIRIQSMLRLEVLGAGGLHLIISAVIFTIVGLGLGFDPTAAFLIAIALGFSSTVLTAKALEARKELDAYHGRVAIGILVLQDIVAVALLAFTGTETPNVWAFGLLALPLLRPILIRILSISGREELMLIFGLLLALGIGELFYLTGLSAKLGALVAGILLSGTDLADDLYDKLWALKEVFLVGFFLQVGLSGFPDVDGFITVLVLLVFLPLKGALFFFLLIAFKLRARTSFMAAASLTAYSEFALIVGAAAASGGLIPEALVVALALLVAISFAINAPLNRAANAIWSRYHEHMERFERNVEHPDHQRQSLGKANFLIVGMGQVGSGAYDFLKSENQRPIGMDTDPGQISEQLQAGRRVIFGDAQDPSLWDDLEIDNLKGVMFAVPSISAKVRATKELRERGFTGPISALLRRNEPSQELVEAGVNSVCLPMTRAGYELARMSLDHIEQERPHSHSVTVPLTMDGSAM